MEAVHVVVLVMVGVAAVIDVRTRRIPNLLTFGGAAAALAYHTWAAGPSGLLTAVEGWAAGVALFLPMFLLRGLGAGDVKLLGAVGAWLGPIAALWCGAYSVFAGGVMALVVGALHGYLGRAFRNLWGLVGFWRAAGVQPMPGLTVADAPGPRLAYGAAIALGTAALVLLK
jgi:prepilin peptidase CpaA